MTLQFINICSCEVCTYFQPFVASFFSIVTTRLIGEGKHGYIKLIDRCNHWFWLDVQGILSLRWECGYDLMSMMLGWLIGPEVNNLNRSAIEPLAFSRGCFVCFVDRCLSFCTFSIGHCVVYSFLRYTNSDYPFGIFELFLFPAPQSTRPHPL